MQVLIDYMSSDQKITPYMDTRTVSQRLESELIQNNMHNFFFS